MSSNDDAIAHAERRFMVRLPEDYRHFLAAGGSTARFVPPADDSLMLRAAEEPIEILADGYTAQGNFLVGADGIGSTTRSLLDANSPPGCAGYVAWRGLEPESTLSGELLHLLSGRSTCPGHAQPVRCAPCRTTSRVPAGGEPGPGVGPGTGARLARLAGDQSGAALPNAVMDHRVTAGRG
ncbi:hypothetical protein [Streptomyces sp. NPDC059215]|uniref:hypothetical protein n=1 Tax=Streptomyces sp. NPDC059215 TaxID=3346772 RepID=UPI0036A33BF4